jgi:hypothetical protein
MLEVTLSMGILGAAGIHMIASRPITQLAARRSSVMEGSTDELFSLAEVHCSSPEVQTILQYILTVTALFQINGASTAQRASVPPLKVELGATLLHVPKGVPMAIIVFGCINVFAGLPAFPLLLV